jgi:hypothetical protein
VFFISRQSQPARKGGTESGGSLTDKNQTKTAELPKDIDPHGVLGLLLLRATGHIQKEVISKAEL